MKQRNATPIIIALLLALIALAFIAGNETAKRSTVQIATQPLQPTAQVNQGNTTTTSLLLPAVTEENTGAVTRLEVEKRPGTGKFYIRSDGTQPIVSQNTRESIDNALAAITSYSPEAADELSKSDFFYSFALAPEVIEGQSAGAAIATATLALVQGRQLNRNTAITGIISRNGSIEQVGAVLEKAHALKNAGITTFIVPPGEATVTLNRPITSENCTVHQVGSGTLRSCTAKTSIETQVINISRETNLNVVEASTLSEAIEIMTSPA